jgi:hypothetical protein
MVASPTKNSTSSSTTTSSTGWEETRGGTEMPEEKTVEQSSDSNRRKLSERIPLPQAVYFDTNILVKVFKRGMVSDFVGLADLARKWRIGLFVPEIVVMELRHRNNERVQNATDSLKNSVGVLQRYVDPGLVNPALPNDMLERVTQSTDRELGSAGICVVPCPDIKTTKLIRMASTHTPPFRDRGRGFKDAVALLTIRRHMESNHWTNALVVSEDSDFSLSRGVSDLLGLDLQISVARSVAEASDCLQKALNLVLTEWNETASSQFITFLMAHWAQILQFVQNAPISKTWLRIQLDDQFGSRQGRYSTWIERVLSTEPREVTLPRLGWFLSKEELSKERRAITFSVRVQVTMLVEVKDLWARDSFPMSAPGEYSSVQVDSEPAKVETIVVDAFVQVEASVTGKLGEFTDLQLHRLY